MDWNCAGEGGYRTKIQGPFSARCTRSIDNHKTGLTDL